MNNEYNRSEYKKSLELMHIKWGFWSLDMFDVDNCFSDYFGKLLLRIMIPCLYAEKTHTITFVLNWTKSGKTLFIHIKIRLKN